MGMAIGDPSASRRHGSEGKVSGSEGRRQGGVGNRDRGYRGFRKVQGSREPR
jgi:hypothetical protein